MPKLVLTRGIPASGKSTWAKSWVQENPGKRVRVNRDDLRRMLFGGTDLLLTYPQEMQVTEAEKAIAKTALEKGKDVVVDATNLRARFVRSWFDLGYDVEFRDFEISLEDALERNEQRGTPVPGHVIGRFYHDATHDGKLPAPPEFDKPGEAYEPNWALPAAIIVDIDGTLAHIPEGGRSPYDYTRVSEDIPDADVIETIGLLEVTHRVIVMSGREDSCRAQTEAWLQRNGVRFDELHMRAAGDKRRDSTVKLELFNKHVRDSYNVRGVYDDRNQVVRMWRGLGIKCYQVAEGAF